MRKLLISVLLMLSVTLSARLAAEACTYSEGLQAYQNGNEIRGDALMRMAATDGDKRALAYLRPRLRVVSIKSNRKIEFAGKITK